MHHAAYPPFFSGAGAERRAWSGPCDRRDRQKGKFEKGAAGFVLYCCCTRSRRLLRCRLKRFASALCLLGLLALATAAICIPPRTTDRVRCSSKTWRIEQGKSEGRLQFDSAACQCRLQTAHGRLWFVVPGRWNGAVVGISFPAILQHPACQADGTSARLQKTIRATNFQAIILISPK